MTQTDILDQLERGIDTVPTLAIALGANPNVVRSAVRRMLHEGLVAISAVEKSDHGSPTKHYTPTGKAVQPRRAPRPSEPPQMTTWNAELAFSIMGGWMR